MASAQIKQMFIKQLFEQQLAKKAADAAGKVVGHRAVMGDVHRPDTTAQGLPEGSPLPMGASPFGLMNVETEEVQPATGLFDKTIPADERFTRAARGMIESGVPSMQTKGLDMIQQLQSSLADPSSNMMNFGAGQRLGVDKDGDQFYITTARNKGTGAMQTVYAPVGHNKPEPSGQLEYLDKQFGLTAGEDLQRRINEERAQAIASDETKFYVDYIPETRVIEQGINDIEMTEELLTELSGQADYSSTGFGKWISGIPLTDAKHWSELKSTIQSQLALGKMMQLKQASSTGSTGFGALSEKELKLLTDHLGSLEQAQTPDQIRKVITRIYKHLNGTKKQFRKKLDDNKSRYKTLHKRYYPTRPLPEFIGDDGADINSLVDQYAD